MDNKGFFDVISSHLKYKLINLSMKPIHIFIAVIVAAIWGCNFVFIKLGVHEVPPLFLCALRFFLASIPAIFFVKRPKVPFKLVAEYGLIVFGLQFALMFSSFQAGMTAGMGSIIGQTQIFFSVFFAVVFLNEVVTKWQVAGAMVAFAGIGLIGRHTDANVTVHGVELVIGAAIVWGYGNLVAKKIGRVNMIALIVWGSFIACVPLGVSALLLEGPQAMMHSMHHFSWLAVISLFYIVYISTWLGYGLWNWLIWQYSIANVVPYILLVPVFGLVSSVLLLNEQLEPWKLLASALVISGLVINMLGPKITSWARLSKTAMPS